MREFRSGGRRRRQGRGLASAVIAAVAAIAIVFVATTDHARGLDAIRNAFGVHGTAPKQVAVPIPPAPPPPPPGLLTRGTVAVPILVFRVPAGDTSGETDDPTPGLEYRLRRLVEAGAHAISLEQLYAHLANGEALPDRPVVLTFDEPSKLVVSRTIPLLKRYHFKADLFVDSEEPGFEDLGVRSNWDELRGAQEAGLISVEAYAPFRPDDVANAGDDVIDTRLAGERQDIERRMRRPVRFLAYRDGVCDARLAGSASRTGFVAAVTLESGWTRSAAESYFLPRIEPKRIGELVAVWDRPDPALSPHGRVVAVDADAPVTRGTYTDEIETVNWVAGGEMASQVLDTRETVGEIASAVNAPAALNGTFFADARVESKAGGIIGPCVTRFDTLYRPVNPDDEPRLTGRPMVLISKTRCLALPYAPHMGRSLETLKLLLPGLTDAFLAGGWIVHDGKAVSTESVETWSTADAQDCRHRAFVGIDAHGRYMLGATQDSVSTAQLGRLLEQSGVQDAWLMDSGFSTSLIWQNRVLVSGRSRPTLPSRPVPHAVLLVGTVAPDAPPPPVDAQIASGPGAPTTEEALALDGGRPVHRLHGRRRRRRHRIDAPTGQQPPADSPADAPAVSEPQPDAPTPDPPADAPDPDVKS